MSTVTSWSKIIHEIGKTKSNSGYCKFFANYANDVYLNNKFWIGNKCFGSWSANPSSVEA
jgi:hypothetical protein